MARILDILLDRQGGIVVGPAGDRKRRKRLKGARPAADESEMSWMLREFELVDMLINQVHTTPVPHTHFHMLTAVPAPHVLILTDAAYVLDPCFLPSVPMPVSFLTVQLELMQPGDRRRSLMALQYALANADHKQVRVHTHYPHLVCPSSLPI
jgi:hypothetical protein